MWQNFTRQAQQIVFYAQEEAAALGTTAVASEHLLLGLLREVVPVNSVWPPAPTDRVNPQNLVSALLNEAGGDLEELRADALHQAISLALPAGSQASQALLTPAAMQVIGAMYKEARRVAVNKITPEFLLLALIGDLGATGQLLAQHGFDLEYARQKVAILHVAFKEQKPVKPSLLAQFANKFSAKPKETP